MRSLAEAQPSVFWLDGPAAPPALPSLVGAVDADLVVVGGGYTGLWTALQAKEADPSRDVVLVEAATVGWAASGRNGGFCASSLTHGEPTAWTGSRTSSTRSNGLAARISTASKPPSPDTGSTPSSNVWENWTSRWRTGRWPS